MKNILLLVAITTATLVFTSCEKEDQNESKPGKLEYLQFELKYDTDGKGPEATAYLFYLENKFVDSPEPHLSGYLPDTPFINDVNGDWILSIGKEKAFIHKDADTGRYINKSTITFTDYDLIGSPNTNGRYVVLIALEDRYYYTTWKEFNPVDYQSKNVNNPNYSHLECVFKRENQPNSGGSIYCEWSN